MPDPELPHLDPHPNTSGDPDVDRQTALNAGELARIEQEMDDDVNTPPPEAPPQK